MWRKLQAEGLSDEYKQEDNETMRSDFHALIALAFVPEEDVIDAFDTLREAADDRLQPVFDHLEDYYLRGRVRRGRGRRQQRSAPMFPPSTWNCYERAVEGRPRTTNTCEAWHRRLNTIVGKHHPSLFVLLDQLQEEVGEVDVEVMRAEGGVSPPKKRNKYEVADQRIARIMARYNDYKEQDDILTYLRSIGYSIAGNL
jgi:hypothetical protein